MHARHALVTFATAFLLGSGCGPAKLNETKNLSVDAGDAKSIDLPAVPKPQKITVEFSSTNSDVTVYLFKEEDAKGEDGLHMSDAKKALAKETGKAKSFTADVPENTATNPPPAPTLLTFTDNNQSAGKGYYRVVVDP